MRIHLVIFFLIGSVFFAVAQDAITLEASGAALNVVYRNESTFGILAHSNGFGLNYRRAKHVTANRKRVFEVELVNMSHPKEVKTYDGQFDNSKGFYYGKLNSLIIPRVGVGFQNVLFRKGERKSIEIRYSTYLGASLCLAKPVYLQVKSTTGTNPVTLSEEKYDPAVHSIDKIYGASSYLKGFGDLSIYPGAYAKFALSFEYGDMRNDVKVLEVGAVFDVYPTVVPIMANFTNYQVFPSLYISLIYGIRWF